MQGSVTHGMDMCAGAHAHDTFITRRAARMLPAHAGLYSGAEALTLAKPLL